MPITGNNLIKESCTGTGSGSLTLTGAAATFFTFLGAGLISNRSVYYSLKSGAEREVGKGTFVSPATMSRDTIFQSSNSNAALSLGAGTHEIIITIPYQKLIFLDENDLIADPTPFRATIIRELVSDFLAEAAPADLEGLFTLGVGTAFDGLGGFFAIDQGAVGAADGIDKFLHPSSPGFLVRAPIKVAPTTRSVNIPAGNVYQMFDAATADAAWDFVAHRDDHPDTHIYGHCFGGANPHAEFDSAGLISLVAAGTGIQIRNDDAVAHDFSVTVERRA